MQKTIRIAVVLSVIALLSLLVVACGGPSATGPNQVHMGDTTFLKDMIQIKKGQKITLVNDSPSAHAVINGLYDDNGHAKSEQEPDAPTVNATIGGYGNQEFGPFNTAGTFHIYCSTHEGMQLTVIVK